MRPERTGGRGAALSTVAVCVLVAGLTLAGCSDADSGSTHSKEAPASPIVEVTSPAAPASLSPSPSRLPYKDNDDVFLAMGDCYGSATNPLEPGQVQEMACDDPAAVGKVRYLKGPHPGDPGGGGMDIRVGDCLSGTGTYREVACDGNEATYKIVKQTIKGQNCPQKNDILVSTDTLLDQVGLSSLAYCARPI